MLTPETIEALAASRRRVDDLVEGHVESVVVSWLNAMRDVEAEVERVAAANEVDVNTRMQRLEIARRDITERIATLDEEVRMNLTSEVNSYVELAAATQPELITTQLPPIAYSFNRPDPEAIAWIVQRTTEQITVRHYYLSAEATKAMQAALRTGVAGGINPNEAAKRMVKDVRGAFHGGLFRATVIARTEMLDAYRASAHETELANSEALDGWTWWANIDNKTCISCIGMHGTDHPLDEPGPQDHHQGRCSRLPKTKSWKALGFDTVDEPDGLEFETGQDWFERQPERVQREIMGPKRFEAWREGRFPPELWSKRVESPEWRDAHHIGDPIDPDDDKRKASDG